MVSSWIGLKLHADRSIEQPPGVLAKQGNKVAARSGGILLNDLTPRIYDLVAADVVLNVSGYKIIDPRGQVVKQYSAGSGRDLVSLFRQDARWLFDTSVSMKLEANP